MNVLVTGAAGFIGMHVVQRLVARGDRVVGIDNLNDYYDPSLKQARLAQLSGLAAFRFERIDIVDRAALDALFATEKFDAVVHLAAQAGVRYSIDNPLAYGQSNLSGFLNVLEACRHHPVRHLVYASSSSVYGGNAKMPFSEADSVDHPVSLYAASKKANELMAHTYSHLYAIPTTGVALLHGLRPVGAAGHGVFLVHARHARRHADCCLQRRQDDARLHLHRRHRRRRRGRAGQAGRRRTPRSIPWLRIPAPRRRPIASSTSATRIPSPWAISSRRSSARWGWSPSSNSSRCSPATSWRRMRMCPPWRRGRASSPRTSLTVGIGRFVEWFKRYYGRT